MEKIDVRIFVFKHRKTYQLQWADPTSGKKKTKSSTVVRPASDASVKLYQKALRAAAKEASTLAKYLTAFHAEHQTLPTPKTMLNMRLISQSKKARRRKMRRPAS